MSNAQKKSDIKKIMFLRQYKKKSAKKYLKKIQSKKLF